jgi:hypothetical protein
MKHHVHDVGHQIASRVERRPHVDPQPARASTSHRDWVTRVGNSVTETSTAFAVADRVLKQLILGKRVVCCSSALNRSPEVIAHTSEEAPTDGHLPVQLRFGLPANSVTWQR